MAGGVKPVESSRVEIEGTVREIGRGLQDLAVKLAVYVSKQETMHDKQEDQEKRLRNIEKLAPALRAALYVLTAFGMSVMGLIWALITGQVTLVFN